MTQLFLKCPHASIHIFKIGMQQTFIWLSRILETMCWKIVLYCAGEKCSSSLREQHADGDGSGGMKSVKEGGLAGSKPGVETTSPGQTCR